MDLEDIASVGIQHQRCAVHTLQLAIKDGINTSCANNLIAAARAIVRVGRSPHINEFIQKENGKSLILDNDTRWGSTYMMISRLLDVEDTIKDRKLYFHSAIFQKGNHSSLKLSTNY